MTCGGCPFRPCRFAGTDFASGKVTIGGSGDSRVSWTTREDIARFMGHVFTHLTTAELSGKTLRIEGDNVVGNHPRQSVKSLIELPFPDLQ